MRRVNFLKSYFVVVRLVHASVARIVTSDMCVKETFPKGSFGVVMYFLIHASVSCTGTG